MLVPAAAAIDLNSSTSLQYFSSGSLGFEVTTSGQTNLQSTLNMNGNSITSYYGSACTGGQAVADVNDDGSFACIDLAGAADVYVNESGDTMSGALNMNGNNVSNLPDPIASGQPVTLGFANNQYVERSGDTMTGNLDMLGNELRNVDAIGNGTTRTIQFTPGGTVEIPNGDLHMSNNNLDDVASIDGGGDPVDFNDLADFKSGAVSRGNINLDGNQITNTNAVRSDGTDLDLFTSGSGTDAVTIFDDAHSAYLAQFNEGGPISLRNPIANENVLVVNGSGGSNVDIPNGNLSLNNNFITGVSTDVATSSSLITVGDADTRYVERSGDSMTGNLDMGNNNIVSVEALNSDGSTTNIDLVDGGNVLIPNGNLDIGGPANTGERLNVNGNITSDSGAFVGLDDNDYLWIRGSDESIRLVTQDSLALEVDSTQNVQIPNGVLNMGGNRIESVGAANSGDDVMRRDNILADFVDAAGDTMTGNLDLVGNDLVNVNSIGNGSNPVSVTSALALGGNNIQNPGSITSYWDGSPCSGTQAVQDINDDGTFSCVETTDTAQDVWVNESGDTMSGDLNMGGNRITNIGSGGTNFLAGGGLDMASSNITGLPQPSNGASDVAVSFGSADSRYVERAGDSMTGMLDLADNNIENVNRVQTEQLNVTNETSNVQIADFTDSGITFHQPFTVESSGPLSVANGIELTDGTSNTIESFSTLYLSTSSGTPTDIVFQPTGVVASQANIDMGGNNITDVDALNPGGTTLTIGAAVNMDSNNIQNPGSITSYWDGSPCSGSQAVQDINDDGTFSCVETDEGEPDVWVNESGDTMSGALNMNGNNISNLPDPIGSGQPVTLGFSNAQYVARSGDTMTGDLDLLGNALKNVDWIGNGTTRTIQFTPSGNVEVPNGNLDVSGGDITVGSGFTLDSEWIDAIDAGGVKIRDDSSTEVIHAQDGGNVEIPNGNLSVGSTSPVETIHLDKPGQAEVGIFFQDPTTATDYGGRLYFNDADSTFRLVTRSAGSQQLGVVVERDTGEVGIGTATPAASLDVNGGAEIRGILNMNSNNITGLPQVSNGASDVAVSFGSADSRYVERAGDSMTGTLDMANSNINNVNSLTFNDVGEAEGFLWGGGRDISVSTAAQGGEDAFIWRTDSTYPIQIETHDSVGADTNRLNISTGVDTAAIDVINANLDMNGNNIQNPGSITSYFGSACGAGQALVDVDNDGSFVCVDVAGAADVFVNESGDTMSGNLNMNGNQVQNLQQATFDNTGNNDFVQVSGTGVSQHTFRFDDRELRFWSGDGAGTVMVLDNVTGNVDISSGNLVMNSNNIQSPGSITSYFGGPCGAGQAIQDVTDSGGFTCTDLGGAVGDSFVNESGDTMSGNLDMGGSNWVQNADLVHGSRLGVATDSTTADSQTTGGFNVYVQDNLTVDGDIIGGGGDVAEKVPTLDDPQPGDVVIIAEDMAVAKADTAYDTRVAGVVSTDPGVVLARERDGKPLALSGIVPVKVSVENGNISPGDLLTTSGTAGHAMKCNDPARCTGAIIGKALEAAEAPQKIKVLVTLG